ncbi:MAG: helix-turn-helix domain-containing protein [bacterium]|nr:helix-turn-helix domain-containing protein [bacterium]
MVYSVTEAAEQLSIGRTMTFHLISVGELGSLKIGNRRLVSRLDLDEFITKRRDAA